MPSYETRCSMIASTRSADRFILDFILLVILLAIVGYIVNMVM